MFVVGRRAAAFGTVFGEQWSFGLSAVGVLGFVAGAGGTSEVVDWFRGAAVEIER